MVTFVGTAVQDAFLMLVELLYLCIFIEAMSDYQTICIAGAGTMGTALGHILADKEALDVTLLSVETSVVDEINITHYNSAYFPQIKLNPRLQATTDTSVLNVADVVFLALPSVVVVNYLVQLSGDLNPKALLVNLSKGFGNDNQTIVENLQQLLPNPVCTLKGPTFARELINHIPTSMTIGAANLQVVDDVTQLFSSTIICTDSTTDVTGVELVSILKNIYAIIIGIVDAQFSSPNLRFLVFTKAFNEMRHILAYSGGHEETMFRYCGIGDFGLTALNDLSRNRTLGLLIGKGFFSNDIPDKVVLEGKIAVGVFVDKFRSSGVPEGKYFLMNELYKVFNEPYNISTFVSRILAS
ncbi:MAG TPA: hypothetical protein DCR43_03980 [Bacteroidales bacterium]|nr:MAG: hypothetical protein A2X11_00675 [Bacteroidetes bacterium GWE2_42_24]OFY27518.1 MAG: hypothetical protein A2X09_07550 [Bacteroidetes bacterium GWF2_43_11]PKP27831.1 MAG: hypothetical protein CVU06_00900 [Bacteroidetes bacterium HGW-Bacteroidetes-22]HAQ65002.1 hypothetical protein [Bacteroidales bacterium]HBZ66041.1 hypothetical protein [Bacteroidales bacterium]